MPRLQHQLVPADRAGAVRGFSPPTPWNWNFSDTLEMWMAKSAEECGTEPPAAPPGSALNPPAPLEQWGGCSAHRDTNQPLVATREFHSSSRGKRRVSNSMNILVLCQQHWPLRALAIPATLLRASASSIYLIINRRSDSNSFCFGGRWGIFKFFLKPSSPS